jgi:hypothetical protein
MTEVYLVTSALKWLPLYGHTSLCVHVSVLAVCNKLRKKQEHVLPRLVNRPFIKNFNVSEKRKVHIHRLPDALYNSAGCIIIIIIIVIVVVVDE